MAEFDYEEECIKGLLSDVLDQYALKFPLNSEEYSFSFYWFKLPFAPSDRQDQVKTALKLYAQKSPKSSPLLLWRKETHFQRGSDLKTIRRFLWRDLFRELLSVGIEELYRKASTSKENLHLEYPIFD